MNTWCAGQGLERGGLLRLGTAWELALAWYHNRMAPDWERLSRNEVQALFQSLGMTGSFWNLSG